MKILVTGHRGLLGSACVRVLSKNNDIVTYNGDLMERLAVCHLMHDSSPDAIIHCAAKVGGVKANRDQPVDFLLDNLVIQNNVISAAHDFGVNRLVFVGTSCLYPKNAPLPVTEESLLGGPFEPDVSAYATAKLAGYALCKAYSQQYGRNYGTCAPCNLYGINDSYGPAAHVIPALMRKVRKCGQEGGPLVIWGDGSAIREFLFADDCAEAIEFILNGWNSPEIINIGSGIGTNMRSLVASIIKVSGVEVEEVVWDRAEPTGIQHKTFRPDKLRHLGWGPTHTLEEGLSKTWEDFMNNQNLRTK